MGAGCHTLRERAPSYALDERTHQPTTVTEKELATHTHKVLKALWERAPTQYGIELQYNMGANSPYTHKSIKGSMGANTPNNH